MNLAGFGKTMFTLPYFAASLAASVDHVPGQMKTKRKHFVDKKCEFGDIFWNFFYRAIEECRKRAENTIT